MKLRMVTVWLKPRLSNGRPRLAAASRQKAGRRPAVKIQLSTKSRGRPRLAAAFAIKFCEISEKTRNASTTT